MSLKNGFPDSSSSTDTSTLYMPSAVIGRSVMSLNGPSQMNAAYLPPGSTSQRFPGSFPTSVEATSRVRIWKELKPQYWHHWILQRVRSLQVGLINGRLVHSSHVVWNRYQHGNT